MFSKILVTLDNSNSAEAVLPYVEELSRKLKSDIYLLHVCSSDCEPNESAHKTYLDKLAADLRHKLEGDVTQTKIVNVFSQTERGIPQDVISSFTVKNGIDLISLTNYGSSGPKEGMLGRVADHITRTTRIPALLVKPGIVNTTNKTETLIKRLVLTLDGSDLSKLALPFAEELAGKFQIPITLFQMAREIYPYYGEAAPFVDYQKLTEDERLNVQTELTSLKEDLVGKGLKVDWESDIGSDAAHEIIELSKKLPQCLVVMSTHGRSGFGRWAFGSVADKVIHYIDAPLLLIPARAKR
jgi:nucleotide-binding universal stress UspA family protein